MKAATVAANMGLQPPVISIHAAREGGDFIRVPFRDFGDISIHAAREGGDAVFAAVVNCNHISIHAAREGGDAS